MAAPSSCRSNRYTGSMWISIRRLRGPQSEQVLMSCGLQGLVHSLTFVVWLLQYPRWGRQRTVTPCRRIPRGLESFQLMHFSSTISNETIRDHCNAIMRNGNMFCFPRLSGKFSSECHKCKAMESDGANETFSP